MGAFQTAVTPIHDGMKQAAMTVPDKLRAEIEKPEWQGWWLAAFRTRLQRAERDAVRLYPELLKMVGAGDAVMELALRALGVSLEIAKQAVGAYQQAQQLDEPARLELFRAALEEAGWTCLPPGRGVEEVMPLDAGGIPETNLRSERGEHAVTGVAHPKNASTNGGAK